MDIKIPGYEIIREIGRGGMATVFLARQESFGREVAIKIMASALASDEGFTQRFLKEGETVAKLMHPNIIKVFNAGVHDNHYYLAMEYFPRGTLRERIRQGLSTGDAVRILRSILEALRYAHGQGFIHRDIKSQNILLYEDGAPVISDFGLVKTAGGNTMMTSSGVAIGSPRYMSPEQIKGGHDIDERSDLYSVGVLFHEMLTGKVPYEAEDTFTIAFKHIYDPIPVLPNNLAAFQSYLERLLAKQREDRFPSAEAAVVALDEIQMLRTAKVPKTVVIDSEKLLHQQHLESQRSEGKRGSKVWKITGTIMVLVALIAGTAVFYLNWRQQQLPVTVERQQEEQRQAELARQQQRQAELERQQQRQAELERQQQRQAELERQQQRQAELERQQEEQRQAELERQQEEQRQAELERQQEEQRQAELERQQEEQRQAELARQQEEQRQAELERQQEEQRQAELERQQQQRQAKLKAQQQAAQLEQLLAQARQAQEAGNLALSLQRIASGLVMMPNSPELLSLLRDVEQQLAEVRQRQAEQQQTEQPTQADPRQKIAELMAEAERRLRTKDYQSSLKQLAALLLLQPGHAKALQLKQQVQAEAEEARLRLNRNKRQWVQRALTELSFDTRGVDGIFGQNSRNAIRAFQRQRGFQITGYLTAQQLSILEKIKPAVATAPPISLVSVKGSDTSAPQSVSPQSAGNTDPQQSTTEPEKQSTASDDAEKAKTPVAVSAEEGKWKPVLTSGERMLRQASSALRRSTPARPARIGGAGSNCSGDCSDGTGTFLFDNGDVYSGEWVGGVNSGKGSYFHRDGSVYVGILSGGNRHGLGTFYYSSGDKFYGDWRNGMRHGKGIYYHANGIKLYGIYHNDRLLEDAVVVFYNNGDKYVGQWKNDKKHGQGIYYERSGRKYAGVWRNNVKVKVVGLN